MKMQNCLTLLLIMICFAGCKKQEPDEVNKPPVAKAGDEMVIQLPLDAAVLDGSSSFDPDGSIVSYQWQQVIGPSSADIAEPQKAKTRATRLQSGLYSFVLSVTDNHGAVSKDTVEVRIQAAGQIIADAGPDKVITLPVMEASLDALGSRDPLGMPLIYQWRKIDGPACQIRNAIAVTTSVVLSAAGLYQFELKVSNLNGIAYDTTKVTVEDMVACNVKRTEVPARLSLIQQLPVPASDRTSKMLVVGNKIIIPQDWDHSTPSHVVFVYDVLGGTLSIKELTNARSGFKAVVAGTKVFFAGGFEPRMADSPEETTTVDIYDASTDTWSTAHLSQARAYVKAATVGNKVIFAGGLRSAGLSNRVDIYDLETNQWTIAEFPGEPRVIERVVTNQQSIYFLGGLIRWDDSGAPVGGGNTLHTPTSTIDMYNTATGSWSTANMGEPRIGFAAVSADDKIIIAGGMAGIYPFEKLTADVEILTLSTMKRTNTCIAFPTAYGTQSVAVKNGSIIFYTGDTRENRKGNIYNPRTGEWKVGVQDVIFDSPYDAALASVNNNVYVLIRNSLYKLDY